MIIIDSLDGPLLAYITAIHDSKSGGRAAKSLV